MCSPRSPTHLVQQEGVQEAAEAVPHAAVRMAALAAGDPEPVEAAGQDAVRAGEGSPQGGDLDGGAWSWARW